MRSENRLAVLIFFVLVALIAVPVGYRAVRERLRPRLVEAQIVTATDRDPVFRNGPRRVAAEEQVEIAVAVLVQRFGGRPQWLAPARSLELDGRAVDHRELDRWPDRDHAVRVFWFTVESSNVGGEITESNAGQKVSYRAFFAPEMGRGLLAEAFPEPHADDHLGLPVGSMSVTAGTLRLYARLEVFDPDNDFKPLQTASTVGAENFRDPDYPAVHRSVDCPEGVYPEVGELFLLPGFEPIADPPEAWNVVPRPSLGLTFIELVERRLAVSSRCFAAVAVTGSPTLDDDELEALGSTRLGADGVVRRAGRPLTWQRDVLPGDLLRDGSRWTVLLEDDGNGRVDGGDTIMYCWRSPPAKATLTEVVHEEVDELELLRLSR
jgi:hypothetical protein